MQAAMSGLELNRNELADSLDFDMTLKTIQIGMVKIINQK